MSLCRDKDKANSMRMLRAHGISRDAWKRYAQGGTPQYEVYEPGFKSSMLDLMAAIGLHQLPRLEALNARRAALAANSFRLLQELPAIQPLGEVPYPHHHAWHLFAMRLELEAVAISRDHFLHALEEEKIGTGLHFPCMHLQKYYRERYGYRPRDLPRAEWNSERLFSLPLYPLLTEADQEDVATAMRKVIRRHAR
jgi:UDP-4-amino-4-deoxy-L-arabinose-oxoglutarate aminotransferase